MFGRAVHRFVEKPGYFSVSAGFPASERAIRGSTNIETLSEEDQELLRIACKVMFIFRISCATSLNHSIFFTNL